MTMRKLAAGTAVGALLATCWTPAAMAQQTTASVRGVAVTNTGAPIKNATITVVHVPSGTREVTQTNGAGVFDVHGLRIGGPYRIISNAPNYVDQEVDDLYLTVGDAERVTMTMAPSTGASDIVVTAAKAQTTTKLANVGSRTTLRHADIDAVVSVKRDIRDVGRRDPLATLDLVARSTGPSGGLYIAGSSPRSNRITIDGVRSQDDFGLNTGGLSTNRGPVSLEAVEQVAIQAAPFDVEEGDFTGGALNLILRSGSNDFHGSAFDLYRTGRLVGTQLPNQGYTLIDPTTGKVPPGTPTNAPTTVITFPKTGFAKVVNKIHESNYGFFFSGPILKDKLFFALSYEDYESFDLTSTGPLGAGFANSFNRIPNVSTGSSATTADINNVLANWNSYAASTKLSPGQDDATRPIIDQKFSAKFDYNITDGQRLTATYRHAFSSVWKRSPNTTSINLDSDWYAQPENEDNYSLQLNSKWSPNLSTEGRVSYRIYSRGQTPPEGQGFAQVSVCTDPSNPVVAGVATSLTACSSGTPTIFFGPDQFRQANALKTTDWSGEYIANYQFMDDHLIKIGYQYKGIHIYDLFVQAAHGVYYFDSQQDFANGIANSLSYGSALDGNINDAAENFSYQVHSLLAQDTWDAGPGLTVNFGVRDDFYVDSDKPTLNTNFVNRYGFNNQTTYDGRSVLMPRFSVKYQNKDFELSGGAGLVSGGIPDVFLGNSYGAQTGALTNSFFLTRTSVATPGVPSTYFDTASGTTISSAVGDALLNIDKSDPNWVSKASAAETALITTDSASRRTAWTNSIAPNFKIPSDWKVNLSFRTRQLGLEFGIDEVTTLSQENVAFRDIRARLLTVNGVQQYTPDGRIRYDGLSKLTAAQRQQMGLPVSSNPDLINIGLFGDIQAYNPREQNWNHTIAFSIGKQWKGFDGLVSYTLQQGEGYGGISEFGTTEGGNGTSSNYYADQVSRHDPNTSVTGTASNLISDAFKINLTYKVELFKGFASRFTLFGENHAGRPINFLMTDPAGISNSRSPTFGVSRDDQLAYIPDLNHPDPTNPLKFTKNGTTVFFADAGTLDQFKALVSKFNIPMGGIVPKGITENPRVTRFDLQYEQDIPSPIRGHTVQFTADIANIGNLLNKHWGVVKEYSNSRAGGILVNAVCATAAGVAVGGQSPVCAAYRYSYTTANSATLATPTIDPGSTLWSVEFGLKYKF